MSIVKATFEIVAAGWQVVGRFGFPLIGALFALKVGIYQALGQTFTITPDSDMMAWTVWPLLIAFGASWTLVYGYRMYKWAIAQATSKSTTVSAEGT